jgi:hypothetical protein
MAEPSLRRLWRFVLIGALIGAALSLFQIDWAGSPYRSIGVVIGSVLVAALVAAIGAVVTAKRGR